MRIFLLTAFLGFFFLDSHLSVVSAQTQVAAWTFDNLAAAPSTSTVNAANLGAQQGTATIYADGTNGSSAWITATTGNELTSFAGSTTNDPRTTSSAGQALSIVGGSSNSANNKAIVIKFSMTNLIDPILSFATRGTSTGFNTHTWSWSVDGSNFTIFGTNTANTGSTFTTKTLDLSSINSLDGATTVYLKLVVTGATSSTGNNRLDNIVVNATDIAAPDFTSGYPNITNLTDVQFDLVVNQNENGKVYYVVLVDGVTAPSSAQVKAGQDNGSNAVSNSGFISVSSSGSDFSKTLIGLLPGTGYDVYAVAEDLSFNLQTNPTKIDVTTNASTVPSINSSGTSITFQGFTGKSKKSSAQSYSVSANNLIADVSVNVTGNFLISTDDVNYSTSLSIASANFSLPQTLYVKFNPSGNTGTQTGTITHSTTGASSKDVTLSAASIDPFNQNFNDPSFLTNSGWTQYSKVGAQVWGSTNFGHTCLSGCTNATADKAAQINGFSGSSQNNEDWLISPQLDLTNFINYPALSFATISAFAGDQLQLKYSADYTGSGDPSLATWTTIDGKFPASNSSTWTNSANIILPKNMLYAAFVYTSSTTAASRWTLDDWKVEDVSSYLNASTINFSFGEVTQGNSSPSQNFTFTAQGYGDITVSAPTGYEVSKDNLTFASSVVVVQGDAANGQLIYVRFSPASKQLKWTGSINFKGAGLDASCGSLIGSSYPKAETFNVATYNMKFFGTDVKDASNIEFGPIDDALQVSNVTTVMQTLAADVFAVEEIADDNAMNQLVSNLSGYSKVVSDRWSYSWQAPDPYFPPQKIGFIYNTSKVQLVSSRVMFASMYDSILAGTKILANYPAGTSSFWSSGRLPFMATFDVTVNGITRRIRMIDIHGKSASDQTSYNRRQYDANVLRDSLNAHYKHDNIILLGDFNDDVYGSITPGAQSSYKSIVDDATNFNTITYTLNQSGASTFPSSTSFIDNIIISNELSNAYVNNSVTVEDPRTYINNYSATTSDHLPVSARFLLSNKTDQTITFNALASKTFGDASITLDGTSSSGMTVTYSSSDPNVATVNGNKLTIIGAGTATITASQAGNSDFNAAADVPQTLIINKADQSITFSALKSKIFGDAAFNLEGRVSSGLTVSYSSSDTTIASITNGNLVTILKTGSVSITASQPGNTNYNTAADIVQSFTIIKANQAIMFEAPGSKIFGEASFDVFATSSSGLLVDFTSTSDKIALNGKRVTLIKEGRASITALQNGDANYNPAAFIEQSFCINPIAPAISATNSNTLSPTLTSSWISENQWYLNGVAIFGATGSAITVTTPGTYKVQARADDCLSQFSENYIVVITEIESLQETISVYPNPTEEYLAISGIHEFEAAQLFDMTGHTTFLSFEKYANEYRADVRDVPSGVYVMMIHHDRETHSLRLVKK